MIIKIQVVPNELLIYRQEILPHAGLIKRPWLRWRKESANHSQSQRQYICSLDSGDNEIIFKVSAMLS